MLNQEEKEQINNILYYLQHHNKNLTKKQDFLIEDLKNLIEKSEIFFSPVFKLCFKFA